MRKKIFRNMLIVACAAVLLTFLLIIGAVYFFSIERTDTQNMAQARALASALEAGEDVSAHLRLAMKSGVRITVIGGDGTVFADNAADAGGMENHLSRKEFQEAIARGEGTSRRTSATLNEQYAYAAVRLSDGRLVRVARSQRTVIGLLTDLRGALAIVVIGVMIISAIFSVRAANRIIRPLLEIDVNHIEANTVYDELTPLLARIAAQNRDLNYQLREMRIRQSQLSEIMQGMREGLIILDARGCALSVNESAKRLLNIPQSDCSGRHLYELCRAAEVRSLLEIAQTGGEAEGIMTQDARALELRAAPVMTDQAIQGYVFLVMDVTEKRGEEQTRREFTANVSHELKTPLTSISGYAEIMQNGMAKEEDMRAFAGRIYTESQRLIALITDIMRLSKLDEGDVRLPFEVVSVGDAVSDVVGALANEAASRHVTLLVSGEGTRVNAVRQLVFEILYNIVDNAIKYNVEGGHVAVYMQEKRVTVRDTGVGIAPADQDKVFQRFYRADKSRSKATGGTGLGLSIVKHAAEYIGAKVELVSEEGKGTVITVTFA